MRGTRFRPHRTGCIFLVAATVVSGCCRCDSWRHRLATNSVVELAFTSSTTPVKSTAEIPGYVLEELSKISGESPFRITDPGQPFNATDIKVSDYNRRLIFAIRSEDYFILCYDSTASEPSAIMFAIHPNEKVAEPIMVGKVQGSCDTPERLKDAYRSGKIVEYRPTFIDF